MRGDDYERALNFVRNYGSSLYPGLILRRELVRSVLGRNQRSEIFVHYTGKFVISFIIIITFFTVGERVIANS